MAQILVTGASGFIGSHLIRELLVQGHQVRALVRPTSDLSALFGLRVTLYLGDLCEPDTLLEPVSGVDYIYHLGAALFVTSRETFQETNVRAQSTCCVPRRHVQGIP